MAMEYECCTSGFFIHTVVIVLLVLFVGLMSGLTLGFISMSLVDIEVLAKSRTPKDRKHAEIIQPMQIHKGTKSNWLVTVVQLYGFPIMLPYYFIPASRNNPTPAVLKVVGNEWETKAKTESKSRKKRREEDKKKEKADIIAVVK
ncbi:hypothetical protein ACFX19_025704 [Malus domestica]